MQHAADYYTALAERAAAEIGSTPAGVKRAKQIEKDLSRTCAALFLFLGCCDCCGFVKSICWAGLRGSRLP